ncbi:MAG: glycerol-3-phosphate acyltransferase [Actinobacteria bacterium]|nr:glycerol-3-phosphate acyltransferase [Actinomycetota bacterium]
MFFLLVNNFYLNTFLILLICYLIGSIPTAYIAGKLKGIDISSKGNKNVGASNTFFVLGKTAGTIVLLIDLAKGYLSAWLATLFSGSHPFIPMLAVTFVIIGHNWMFPIGFKGGKGTAALVGALAYFAPLSVPVFILLLVPLASFLVRDSFLGHGIAMFIFAFIMWLWEKNYWWAVFMLLVTLVYSLRCLDLYKTYFTEKRRYMNPLIKMLFKLFLRKKA